MVSLRETAMTITATITGRHRKGYFATILACKVNTFIAFDKEGKVPVNFTRGEKVTVNVAEILENGVRVKLAAG